MGFAEVKTAADSASLVRKILEAVVFLAPTTTALPASLTDAAGALVALPAGYWPLGLFTGEGLERTIEVEKEEVEAFGYALPVRTDITKAPSTLKVTPQEFGRKNLMEVIYGMDLSTIVQGGAATSGEIIFNEPPLPVLREYRFIMIGRDGTPDSEWLIGLGFGRVKLATLPNTKWAEGEPFTHELEFNVLVDEATGSPARHYIGGTAPKATAMRTKLGFTQGA